MSTHNLSVVLTGNTTSLKSALMAGGREVETFNKKVQSTGQVGASTGKLLKMGLAAGVLAVGAAMVFSIGQAVAFDREMRNVQSITKVSDAELGNMGETLIDMSTRLPQSAKTLAEGLYQIASSGFQGAEGMEVLEQSAIAASAGLTTTEVSARAITSVLNAYGMEASEAADVSDVLFQTVNVGVVSFEELAGTIGDVVGTAAAATVGVDELGSAIATMTLSGISASEAGTSLNRLIQAIIDPSDDLAQALHDVGYESGATALQTDSLSVVIEKLRVASNGNIETLLKWFPEIRAARGALALMSDEGRNYAGVVAVIEDREARAGAARAALTEQMKSVSAQWEIFKNRINAGAITIGTKMLPMLIALMNSVTSLGQAGIPVLIDAVKRLEPFFNALWQTMGHVVDIGEEVIQLFGPMVAAFAALGGMLAITALNAFAEALESVAGFLADHPALIQAVALMLAAQLVPSLLATTQGFLAGAAASALFGAGVWASAVINGIRTFYSSLQVMALNLNMVATAGTGAAASMTALRGAINAMGGVVIAAGIFAVVKAVQTYQSEVKKAESDGKAWADSFAGNFDPAKVSLAELEGEIDRLGGAADEMQAAADNAINPFLDDRLKTARDELRATQEPLIEIRDTAKLLQEELGITAQRAMALATDQEFMAQATDGATGELDAEAAAALEAQGALSELSDQLKSMFDPLFGLQDAALGLRDAQIAAAEAAAEHGKGSAEAIAANQEATRAAVDYQSALIGLKAAVADGTVNIESSVATLYAWADAGVITEEQARQSEREIRGMGDTAEDVDGQQVIVTGHANTETAMANLRSFKAYLDAIPKTYTVTINGVQGTRVTSDYRGGQYGYTGQRWGGVVTAYAQGGIHAHVARTQMVRYAEPSTGGEAFVPRRGNPARSTAVLNEAASWYGMRVVKMAQGGILSGYRGSTGGTGGSDVKVLISGAGMDRTLLEWLRKSIRIEGGGNVQVALGQGA